MMNGFKGGLKKNAVMMVGILMMGFFLSFLIECNLGTDPCTFMNLKISSTLGILFGTWQVCMNLVLLALVFFLGKQYIGFGTVANMLFIGYIADFCRFLWAKLLPAGLFVHSVSRIPIFIFALAGFILGCAFYMNAGAGLAPYDAIPVILHERVFPKVSFRYVRMAFDFTAIGIGILFGAKPNPGIILMALFLGPVVTAAGSRVEQLMNGQKMPADTKDAINNMLTNAGDASI